VPDLILLVFLSCYFLFLHSFFGIEILPAEL
jgi:hypothetical protein